jgi:hypothetical protein
MLPRTMMEPGPIPKNGCEGASLDIGICSFWKVATLMRLRAALPSIRTWYNLNLAMVGEMTSGSYPAPAMFLGQSEASKPIDVSIQLWWGATLGTSAAAATTQRRELMMGLDVMSEEPPYMMWSVLRCSSMLESEWP